MKSKQQSGFTLIELVIVIVILGILAVTALPRFVDLSTEAAEAAVEGVAGALSSAMAINYAACQAESSDCVEVDNCTDGSSLLVGGALPTGYTITAEGLTSNGATLSCTVAGEESQTATFQGIGAGQ